MIVIIKNLAGVSYRLKNGRMLDLKGGCFMNEVSKADYDDLIKNQPTFTRAVDKGFIVVNDTKDKAKENKAVDDTKQEAVDKQESALKANKKNNGIALERV